MSKKLTVKEAKLVKAKAEGKSHKEAYVEAGYSPTTDNAMAVNANKVLSKPNVQEALQKELARQGITLEQVVAPVTRALTDDNIDTQLKGHDRAMKILGANQDKGNTVNVNFNQIVQDQRERYGD